MAGFKFRDIGSGRNIGRLFGEGKDMFTRYKGRNVEKEVGDAFSKFDYSPGADAQEYEAGQQTKRDIFSDEFNRRGNPNMDFGPNQEMGNYQNQRNPLKIRRIPVGGSLSPEVPPEGGGPGLFSGTGAAGIDGTDYGPNQGMGTDFDYRSPREKQMSNMEQLMSGASSDMGQWSPEQTAGIQTGLKDLGHYTGEIDSMFGPKSVAALRDYQDERIPQTAGDLFGQDAQPSELNFREDPKQRRADIMAEQQRRKASRYSGASGSTRSMDSRF